MRNPFALSCIIGSLAAPGLPALLANPAAWEASAAVAFSPVNAGDGPVVNGSLTVAPIKPVADTPPAGFEAILPVEDPAVSEGAFDEAITADSQSPAGIEPDVRKNVVTSFQEAPSREGLPLGQDAGLLHLGDSSDVTSDGGDAGEATIAGLPRDEAWRVGGSLAAVLGVVGVLAVLARRFGGPLVRGRRPSGVLEILARYPLGRGHSLILLKMDRRVLLLHQNGASMSALCDVSEPEEVASLLARLEAGAREHAAGGFRDVLRDADAGYARLSGDIETVDLTRTQGGALGRSFARRQAGA